MKKTMKYLSMAALALVGAMMTGCSSDEDSMISNPQQPENKGNVVTLTTTVALDGGEAAAQGTNRALTADGKKTFAAGDRIAIIYKSTYNHTVAAVSEALPDGEYGKNATFTVTLTDPQANTAVRYVYPAAMVATTINPSRAVNDDENLNHLALLTTQNGTLAKLGSTHDLAVFDGSFVGTELPETATLKNKLAILACTLKNSDGSSDITSTITGMSVSDGSNTYGITRSAAAGPIYVAIKPTSSSRIYITATDGSKRYTKSLTGKTYAASNGYNISWRMTEDPSLPEGALPGKFAINSGNKQVYFSKGNLQATYDGSEWTWAFAENQWDFIGNAEGNTKVTNTSPYVANYTGSSTTVDLFGWVGSSSNWTGAAQYGITSSTTTNSQSGYGRYTSDKLKSDWGQLAITNGGNTPKSGWRTLTSLEWKYLFLTRTTGGVAGTKPQARYTFATINTDGTPINGAILFPDFVNFAESEFTTLRDVNQTTSDGTPWATKCTSAEWAALANKGCIFLPAAGARSGTKVASPTSAFYWSSSPNTSNVANALCLFFTYDTMYTEYALMSRNRGQSVRLVRAVQ